MSVVEFYQSYWSHLNALTIRGKIPTLCSTGLWSGHSCVLAY